MDKETLNIVVPVYNEEKTIDLFFTETEKVIREISELEVDYLFVDDGSQDSTLEKIKKLQEQNPHVHYLSFSRNFGKEAAIYAGLEYASGEYVAIMDCDLQDPPALLPEMYRLIAEENYDCVRCRRVSRKGEPIIRSLCARLFYKIINKISKADIVDGARDFQFMNRKVVDAIVSMKEYNRFSKGIFGWVGFKKKWLEYENVERVAGETKWSIWKLFHYAFDGIVAFSTVPLTFSSYVGLLFFMIAFIMIIVIIVKTLVFGDPVAGWPSLACIVIFVSGIQLFCMGILGQYMAKTYLESKNRPIYIINEKDI
ncbi:MAG: glycosyltransferase family 2 protein [Lachnospiraceae bacterium]|nr:glycosyltransferase family 2 protein [Lachnospiraceae bacterium]